ncbi:MAG: aldose 1-epimerase [bacterium]|nr:aldose 1-epimerase [bacterium]
MLAKSVLTLSIVCNLTCMEAALAGDVREIEEHGQRVIVLSQGDTVAKLAPAAGGNVYSIEVDGTEYLHQPPSADRLAGVGCGVPILYPTPNRVKDASFTFVGRTVTFTPNAGRNFIHGLVNRYAWEIDESQSDESSASVRLIASFDRDSELHRQFPFPHRLYLQVLVTDRSVRWQYTVDNQGGSEAVPFGFALHPYFLYQGQRSQTYLTIPATHWMEAQQQLPSGKLIPALDLDYPLGMPMSLADTRFDDVFYGLRPENPTRIEFRDVGLSVLIRASSEFKHLVVWTPDRPYFGVESQTCSTDAHNLYAAGYEEAAQLQVCAPGRTMTGWVEYDFSDN